MPMALSRRRVGFPCHTGIADLSSFFVCQILDGLAALPQLGKGKDSAAWGIFPKQAGLEHNRYILLIGTSSGQAAVVGEEKCEHIFFGDVIQSAASALLLET